MREFPWARLMLIFLIASVLTTGCSTNRARAVDPVAGAVTPMSPSTTGKVFRGYFTNADYSNPQVYLGSGDQTKGGEAVQDIAKQFNDSRDVSTVRQIFSWMQMNLSHDDGEKFGRTVDDILNTRTVTGCTDNGLVFASLARAKGIPAVFVQTARMDWVYEVMETRPGASMIRGHILVEVYINDRWYLVDSTAGKLFEGYDPNNMCLDDGYYAFAKSLEVWDTGVRNESENFRRMMQLFANFSGKYTPPFYTYIDLNTGLSCRSTTFEGQVRAGVQASILGARQPVELFKAKYLSDKSTQMAGFAHINQDDIVNSDRVVILYTNSSISSIPDYLHRMAPEIRSGGDGLVINLTREGKRIILIKGATPEALMEIISGLPEDFLDSNYPRIP